ncbi:MAG TPA: pyruvate dehydrogenase complex E1 component subunit beta [Actinomycetota bacterium]|nr:pyruvate dehydrogenase complex E1 component subunit beta [Actinomycetota bacterium]
MSRQLSYGLAINEAMHQLMERDESVFLTGQGVISPWYVGNTTQGLFDRFGPQRIVDTPVSELCITGAAVGAALAGMRPVVIHPRMDFMLLAVDQVVNQAANWHYMSGGRTKVPVTVRGIVNRGGEQAAQHSQSFHALYAHVPGLKVVMPATPHDAKGLLISAVLDDNPVVYIDDRWLYEETADVPEDFYEVELGKARVAREGKDVTIVATSWLSAQALIAAQGLADEGIEAEVIDLRTLKPLDSQAILESVAKTGRLVVADGGWRTCGYAAEVIAGVATEAHDSLRAAPVRVTLPDVPAPMSKTLEAVFYRRAEHIADGVRAVLGLGRAGSREETDGFAAPGTEVSYAMREAVK